jgi:hypothetical protein
LIKIKRIEREMKKAGRELEKRGAAEQPDGIAVNV